MVRIAVYVEGGGPTHKTQDPIRRGFSEFFWSAVRAVRMCGGSFQMVVCGGRREAYDKFCDALINDPDFLNILLVDSEGPVAIATSPWTHLLNRPGDGWVRPAEAGDEQCQMMVVCMEAWFLADPAGLKRHYRRNFDEGKLPPADLAESRSKAQIEDALTKATRNTSAGQYRKIRDGAKLLEEVDPVEVRKHCKWCERLFGMLSRAIGIPV